MPVKILFVGETWRGSSARSLCAAMSRLPDVEVDEIGEDHYSLRGRSLVVRGSNRLLRPWLSGELAREIGEKLKALRPDVLMVYKGSGVPADAVRDAKRTGVYTVNVFPDCSPHAHGGRLRAAMGEYDLVISTKPFHPAGWSSIYGYHNRCICVPHGYDPETHYWPDPPSAQDVDIVLAATWRPEYQRLMQELASALKGEALRVGILGSGWRERAAQFPSGWEFAAPLQGRLYGQWLRRSRIAIAPVNREAITFGVRQPGDEDTTRSYELAAAGCFFLHRRTPFAQTLYDEGTEVPMWDNVEELAMLIHKYLPQESERRTMAARAHARAVPAYSIVSRAQQVQTALRQELAHRGHCGKK